MTVQELIDTLNNFDLNKPVRVAAGSPIQVYDVTNVEVPEGSTEGDVHIEGTGSPVVC